MSDTPTLSDVAKAAGVSTATVSRCLNAPDRVVRETRERVLGVVEALGYTPNFAARAMAAKRSFTIGAIIPTMDNAIFARGMQAFQVELHARGYTLLVASSGYQPALETEQIRALASRGADGLLLIGHDRDPGIYADLARRNVPVLVAWSYLPDAPIPSIGFNNRDAMFTLADRVIRLGHRRIAMISGICAGNDRARARRQGVEDALHVHGLDPTTLAVVETAYDIDTGAAAFQHLMEARPSVVLCGNDVLAAGAIGQANAMGLRVPEDVSITGFDDLDLARIVTPPLTTIRVPHVEMGRAAARALIEMVETAGAGRSERLDTQIIARGSLAAPG